MSLSEIPTNPSTSLRQVESQINTLTQKLSIQTKRIKFLRKQNQQLKHKQDQSDEISEEIIDQNTTLKKTNRQLKNRLNQIKKQLMQNRTAKGPETVTISDIVINYHTQQIDLPKSQVGDQQIETIRHFRENLVTNKGLDIMCCSFVNMKKLFLNNNKISDEGLLSINKLKNLRCLDIRSNQLTDISLKNIGKLSELTQLSISNNLITDQGIQHLLQLSNLRYLDATSNQITNKGAILLLKLDNLANLYLSHNSIQAILAEKLITKLCNLRVLDLRFNDISKEDKIQVKDKIKSQCQLFL